MRQSSPSTLVQTAWFPFFLFLCVGCGADTTRSEADLGVVNQPLDEPSTSPVSKGFKVGPEIEQNPISLEPTYGSVAALAFDGTNYLVVWERFDSYSGNASIYATRVTQSREVLDLAPIEIAKSDKYHGGCVAASDGSGFVVGYRECEEVAGSNQCQFRFRRIGSDGTAFDEGGVPLVNPIDSPISVAMASNGTNYLVTWAKRLTPQTDYLHAVKGAIVTDHDQLTVGTPFDVTETSAPTASGQLKYGVAASGSNYLLAYSERSSAPNTGRFDIAVRQVSSLGTVMPVVATDRTKLVANAVSNSPLEVGSDGVGFLVAWTAFTKTSTSTYNEAVFGARVLADGTFQDAAPLQLSTAESSHSAPQVSFNGERYLIAWQEAQDGPLSNLRGTFLGSGVSDVPTPIFDVVDGKANSGILPQKYQETSIVALSAPSFNFPSAYVTAFSDTRGPLEAGKRTPISVGPRSESLSGTACSKQACMSLWTESHYQGPSAAVPYSTSLQVMPLSPEGQPRQGAASPLVNFGTESDFRTAIASDGSSFAVAWSIFKGNYRSQIFVQTLDPQGTPSALGAQLVEEIDGFPHPISLVPDVSGTGYVLAYDKSVNLSASITGKRIARRGEILADDAFSITRRDDRLYLLRVDANAKGYLVASINDRIHNVQALDHTGRPMGAPIAFPTSANTSLTLFDVAGHDDEFLVAYCPPDGWSNSPATCIPKGLLVRVDGTSVPLSSPLGPACLSARLVWSGNAYLVESAAYPYGDITPNLVHLSELVIDRKGTVKTEAHGVSVPSSEAAFTAFFARSAAGVLWSYARTRTYANTGDITYRKLQNRLISGLCLGDPLGDMDGNGICDSLEASNHQQSGSGGASSTGGAPSTMSAAGGTANGGNDTAGAGSSGGTTQGMSDASEATLSHAQAGASAAARASSGGSSALGTSSYVDSLPAKTGSAHSTGERHLEGGGFDCSVSNSRQGPSLWLSGVLVALFGSRRRRRKPSVSCRNNSNTL